MINTKEEWINLHFEKFQNNKVDTLIEVMSNLLSVYEQYETSGNSLASKVVLNNAMECVSGFIDKVNEECEGIICAEENFSYQNLMEF